MRALSRSRLRALLLRREIASLFGIRQLLVHSTSFRPAMEHRHGMHAPPVERGRPWPGAGGIGCLAVL